MASLLRLYSPGATGLNLTAGSSCCTQSFVMTRATADFAPLPCIAPDKKSAKTEQTALTRRIVWLRDRLGFCLAAGVILAVTLFAHAG